ncbi:unnamed protein product [Moneuplotes crassus]|uniref:Thioredoxin-like fold domain-containing protein n=2 Tax=Euplotes crassus TaxID=5936 RepID=A0AAD1XUR3_EUPCR|nr:unnamed protein product [Moneuplotes crassus]
MKKEGNYGDSFLKKKIQEKETERNEKFEPAGEEEFEGVKIVAYYFSAYHCPASRIFNNSLKEVYNSINLDEKFFEVVYVPCDFDEDSHRNNYAYMPWLSFKFNDENIALLKKKYQVKQIPYLVVVDPQNEWQTLSIRGRKEVQEQPEECFELWLSNQKNQKYTDPVPDTPISTTITDEAKEAMIVYKQWEEDRKREKEEEREREEKEKAEKEARLKAS